VAKKIFFSLVGLAILGLVSYIVFPELTKFILAGAFGGVAIALGFAGRGNGKGSSGSPGPTTSQRVDQSVNELQTSERLVSESLERSEGRIDEAKAISEGTGIQLDLAIKELGAGKKPKSP
jgi:hypothetical protein